MNHQRVSDTWTLKTVWFCVITIFLGAEILFAVLGLAGLLLIGPDAFRAFRQSSSNQLVHYLGWRVTAVAVCLLFARVRRWQDFVDSFGLARPIPRMVVLSALLGLWLAFFVKCTEPGAMAHFNLRPYFSIWSFALPIGALLEETAMRGFLFPALRKAMPLGISIALVFAIDSLFLHPGPLFSGRGVVAVVVVNVAACLLRERAGGTWPAITIHMAYNIPFAFLVWMRDVA